MPFLPFTFSLQTLSVQLESGDSDRLQVERRSPKQLYSGTSGHEEERWGLQVQPLHHGSLLSDSAPFLLWVVEKSWWAVGCVQFGWDLGNIKVVKWIGGREFRKWSSMKWIDLWKTNKNNVKALGLLERVAIKARWSFLQSLMNPCNLVGFH